MNAAAIRPITAAGVRLLADTGHFFSVAERAGWTAAVLSRRPVGIDLEDVSEADLAGAAVLDGVDYVDLSAWNGLAGVWAAREATLKATGHDLTGDRGGWRFKKNGAVVARGLPTHLIDLTVRIGMVVAVAYVGD